MQPEARIAKAIRSHCKERGAFVFTVWGSSMMMTGLPDLIVCYRGIFIGFEVKTPMGDTSTRQRYVHRLMRNAGGIIAVPRNVSDASVVLDRVDVWVDAHTDAVDDLRTMCANANENG